MKIDIHSHLMSVAFLEHLRGRDAVPTAVRDGTGYIAHCAPGLSLPYRPPILSVEAKLADMDMAGIDLAVLSHGLPGPHMLGGAQADNWAARINDELAAIAAAHPGRFAGWANLGFGDLSRTIAEADRCLDQLGLAGFQVWSNVGGRPLDDPGVLPVLEHLADRGAAIHLHPAPASGHQGLAPATMLGFAFPVDTSLAVLRLIGAELGVAVFQRRSPVADGVDVQPVQVLAGRMLFGTDHPYATPRLPQDLTERLPYTQTESEQILAGNAQRLLRLGRIEVDATSKSTHAPSGG